MEGETVAGTTLKANLLETGSENNVDDPEITAAAIKGDKDDDSCSICTQVGMLLINTLLTFTIAVIIIVLTAVGKPNISTYDGQHEPDKKCSCTLFTPSLAYGLAITLFIEIGLMITLIIFAVIASVTDTKYSKLFTYYAYVAGSFIALNFFGFVCMTIAVLVFAGMGTSLCCSATSIAVAALSAFLLLIKTILICCFCCITLISGD